MRYWLLGGAGLVIGTWLFWKSGWLIGLSLGLMAAEIFSLRERLSRLEARPRETAWRASAGRTGVGATLDPPLPQRSISSSPPDAKPAEPDRAPSRPIPKTPAPSEGSAPPAAEPLAAPGFLTAARPAPAAPPGSARAESAADDFADLPGRIADHVKAFFTTGNLVTKIGVIVLFFGFAFLLKYTAQRDLVPIEFRLMLVFLGGLALLGAGWRLRGHRRIYGLILQGGGVGVLYLTIYAAARVYHLLPYGPGFAVMLLLVILSGVLAVLQDAKSLALFGIAGGFLAPVLMSTGAGSHVVLFSYYAPLNLGIVMIAWKKAWRELNLTGFYFTFVIASLWGGRYYQPAYFSSTEPFLILFFLFYVAISVLHALRQPPNLKGYVDGTLVFGVPLVAFGLQYGLVRDTVYGLALSALVLGLFYILLAAVLWRRRAGGMRMLIESFLAFGVVFGSLAIPLALDGRWTSAAWAIEGSAILWIGVRQHRLLPRIAGLFLQAGAGIFFLTAAHLPSGQFPVANRFFVGCTLLSLAGLFSGWYLGRQSEGLQGWERRAEVPLMVWGLVWWFGAGLVEIDRFVPWPDGADAMLGYAAISFLLMDLASRRLSWQALSRPPLLLVPAMGLACLLQLAGGGGAHFFARWGWMAWAVAFGAQVRLLWSLEKEWPVKVVPGWHQATLWLLLLVVSREAAFGAELLVPGKGAWAACAWGVVPGAALLSLLRWGNRLAWPVRRFEDAYFGTGTAVPMVLLFAWAVLVNLYPGDPAPLPFIPLVNPVELTQLFLLLLALFWIRHRAEWLRRFDGHVQAPVLTAIVFAAGFLLLNAMAARAIHFHGQVPYTAEALYRSVLFQAALSILWGVTALVATLAATRKRSRPAWIAGASILGLVVVKLFAVDLAGTGTVARIVSFLCVGSLMLLIGYFSPLPPSRKEAS